MTAGSDFLPFLLNDVPSGKLDESIFLKELIVRPSIDKITKLLSML
jgi:hypothetical protein